MRTYGLTATDLSILREDLHDYGERGIDWGKIMGWEADGCPPVRDEALAYYVERFYEYIKICKELARVRWSCQMGHHSNTFTMTPTVHVVPGDDGWYTTAYLCDKCGHRQIATYADEPF